MAESPKDFVRRHRNLALKAAREYIEALDQATVLFCACPPDWDMTFDFDPLSRRFPAVDLFIYAGRIGSMDTVWNRLRNMNQRGPVGEQLTLSKLDIAMNRFVFREEDEPKSPLGDLFQSIPRYPAPDWAFLTKLSRLEAEKKSQFWLLCISGDPLAELRRLYSARGLAPTYLALYGANGRILRCS